MKRNLGQQYSPLFFLSALGNGGLTVAFFIFFMFMTPHPDSPIATFDTVWRYLSSLPAFATMLGVAAYAFMLYFAYRHFRMLTWNVSEYRVYKRTGAFRNLAESNNEILLMAIPLTLTMTINVMFVLGAMLVPGLWNVVEYLFPPALLAFAATGIYSLVIFYRYYSKMLVHGNFKHALNNSLSQMLSSFTFAMNGVGFAAPAAMSDNMLIVPIAAFCAIFFLVVAVVLAVKNLVLGFYAMLEQGISRESSASIWILIPILTLIGITVLRLDHGFHNLLGSHSSQPFIFLFCSAFLSLQIFIGILGFMVMRQNQYFSEFVYGIGHKGSNDASRTPASYALICPGVAFWVFGMFFLDKALVEQNLLQLFSASYFLLILPLLLVLLQTIRVNSKLNRRLL